MILKLSKDVTYTKHIKPVKLPKPSQTFQKSRCQVSGWGAVDGSNDERPDFLMFADFQTMPNPPCRKFWDKVDGVSPNSILDSMLCARGVVQSKTCYGDSGGPLVCQGVLAGVVSWGETGCVLNDLPSVFGRVSDVLPWISNILKGNGHIYKKKKSTFGKPKRKVPMSFG